MKTLRRKAYITAATALWMVGSWSQLSYAAAENDNSGGIGAQDKNPNLDFSSTSGSLLRVIISLIIIIGIIVLIIKFLAKRTRSLSSGQGISILAGVGLGPNRTLQVVQIGSRIYLLGVGEDIRLLEKIEGETDVEAFLAALVPQGAQRPTHGFGTVSGFMKGLLRKKEPKEEELTDTAFEQVFREKMKHLSGRKNKLEEWTNDTSSHNRSSEP